MAGCRPTWPATCDAPSASPPTNLACPPSLRFLCCAAVLSAALSRLRSELRAAGSDLCVRVGPWGEQLGQLAAAAGGAAAVVSEAEVELKWVAVVCRVG